MLPSKRMINLASNQEVRISNTAGCTPSSRDSRSVLIIAFQFLFESHLQGNVVTMARQYARNVISSVQRVAMAITPSGLGLHGRSKTTLGSPEALTLARWICQSYRQVKLHCKMWKWIFIHGTLEWCSFQWSETIVIQIIVFLTRKNLWT